MATDPKASVLDDDVCAPEALNLSDDMHNEKTIMEWWGRVKLYAEAMYALDRAVLLYRDEDNDWRLSSIEAVR